MIWRALELLLLWFAVSCAFGAVWIFACEITRFVSSRNETGTFPAPHGDPRDERDGSPPRTGTGGPSHLTDGVR